MNKNNDIMIFMKKILDDVDVLNKKINEKGLNNRLKLQISIEMINNNMTDTPECIQSKKRKRLNEKQKSKVEKSKYKKDIEQMLFDGATIDEIATFLREQGEDISKSSVGRYAQRFFQIQESNTIKSEVSHDA